ncbi:MAG: hypothetical protein CSA58_07635 [Micrococcales bacterium]|nr:MAG: hypothetical protein CSB46_04100 [Micrococcales bacterium]PIE26753.1 MAG: hypothetical protein CSA58_07635 [Micrococcales bacterium]
MSINTDKGATPAELDQEIRTPYSVPRVNLLPPEVLERRAVRKVKIGAAAGLVATLAVAGGLYTMAAIDRGHAQDDLAAQQQINTQLQAEADKYVQVPRILSLIDAAKQGQREAMSRDIAWSTVVGQIAATYPSDVWLTNLKASLNAEELADAGSVPTLADPGVATVTVDGQARSHPAVANWLDSLETVPNVAGTSLSVSELVEEDGQVVAEYTNTATLGKGAYTHKYDQVETETEADQAAEDEG